MIVFTNTFKRILRQPLIWFLLLLFPLIFIVLINLASEGSEDDDIAFSFGVVDQDDSALSRSLVNQLKTRYTLEEVEESDIDAMLTDSEYPWILLIRDGYGEDVLGGRAPKLEGYSLSVSEVSALGSLNAENITRALMLLGTDDPDALTQWESQSAAGLTRLPGSGWSIISFWFGMYGMVALYTALFVVRTLLDDKRYGMPDRLGVLPQKPRTILIQGALAAFLATEITTVLLLVVVQTQLGAVPNPFHLFMLLSLYNLFSVGFVLALTTLARDMGGISIILTMFGTIFAMLGGLFWPLSFVPEFMQRLAYLSPGYWLSRGLAEIENISFTGYGMSMLFLFGFTVVAILLGGWRRIQKMED